MNFPQVKDGWPNVERVIAGGFVTAALCLLVGCGGASQSLAVDDVTNSTTVRPETSSAEGDSSLPGIGPERNIMNPAQAGEPTVVDSSKRADFVGPTQPVETGAVNQRPSSKSQDGPLQVKPQQLLGRWRDSFFGTRTLVFREDGTASMILELDFAGRLLYGSKLDFDMTWRIYDGKIRLDATGGRPARQAKSALKTWGDAFEYMIVAVADNEFEIRECEGTTCYRLKRIPDDPGSGKPTSPQP